MADEMREDAQEKLLAQVMRYCPTVRQVIERDGQRTLDDYLDQLADFPAACPLSPPQDVSDCARAQLAPLLGDEIAAEAAQGLVDSAFTATHHGVDYFAPSVQGSLLYRHLLEKRGISCQAVPLLGFGYSLAKGVEKAVQEQGWLGVMTGGLSATAGGIAAAVVFAVLMALLFKPGDKR